MPKRKTKSADPESSNIWFVSFPTYQYLEDVKELARQHGLRVVDAIFDDGKGAKNTPTLTTRGEDNAGL